MLQDALKANVQVPKDAPVKDLSSPLAVMVRNRYHDVRKPRSLEEDKKRIDPSFAVFMTIMLHLCEDDVSKDKHVDLLCLWTYTCNVPLHA